MIVKDRIYGSFEINEEILIELLNSAPVQRLKNIAQYGVPDEYYMFKNYSRYEHSVGVMLLVRRLGASVEEQIAGLLHDVSHTAFSHVVDWVLGSGEREDHQDKIHNEVFVKSSLPGIIEKYGFDWKKISDYKNFALVEQPTPRLCADRIDYALREFKDWAAPGIVNECVDSFVVRGSRIVFSSKPVARKFADAFMKCQMEHWGGAQAALRYTLLSSALKIAIEKNIVKMTDFLKDDRFIMEKVRRSDDAGINEYLSMLASKKLSIVESPKNPQYILKKKFRFVDPDYSENNRILTLSKTDSDFAKSLNINRKINAKGLRLSVG